MSKQIYEINYLKGKKACSIEWTSEEYSIHDLEPRLNMINCDDGELSHDLTLDDFRVLSLKDFEPVKESGNIYRLFFRAEVLFDLENEIYKDFKEALSKTNSEVIARLEFLKNGEDVLDKEGEYIYLFDGDEDNTAKFVLKNIQ